MISPEKLEYASKQAIHNCLKVQKGETVTIITDNATKHIAEALKKETMTVTDQISFFVMEDFGPRPEDGSKPLPFPSEMGEAMKASPVTIYCAGGERGEQASFRVPMLKVASGHKIRHAHMIGINDQIMEMGMCADYKKIQELTSRVYKFVKDAKQARVTTERGSDFTAEFNPNWKWVMDDGLIKPGAWTNLPGGEVWACPQTVNGTIVIDGILGDQFCQKYGPIKETPLTIKVRDGRVVESGCDNQELLKEFREDLKIDKDADRLGEFAFGTNIALDRFIKNMLQDEKFPGMHIAVGSGFPEHSGSDWASDGHIDGVILKANAEVDGKVLMKDGEFVI